MESRCTQKRDLFENPEYLETVLETWRKEIFDAERKPAVRRKRGTSGVSAAVRSLLGAIRRALTFERSERMKSEIRSQGLMYVIVSLFVLLVAPLLRYAV